MFGVWPGKKGGFDVSNLTSHGGFFPNGPSAVFAAIIVVIFSMVGAEVATIAAAESDNPGKAITRATNSVVLRIAVFYVGSILLVVLILPWNSKALGASPFVAAFRQMGIPGVGNIMNAVVLTAVLSCLNWGLYTSSRMLFVLAARREAPIGLLKVNRAGVPMAAILSSSVVGFLCVIAAAISPKTVFSFLLNSSGAIILFVYLLICISQIVLRRRTGSKEMIVKMWLFPFLSIFVALGILAILGQMAWDSTSRPQFIESLGAWALVVIIFFVTKRMREREVEVPDIAEPTKPASRVLVLANQTVEGTELLDELRSIDRQGHAECFVSVPANPIDTGAAMHEGAVYMWDATTLAAQERLDRTLEVLHSENLEASGELGNFKPMQALADAVGSFHPDRIVICTLPEQESAWLRFDLVGRAREAHGCRSLT